MNETFIISWKNIESVPVVFLEGELTGASEENLLSFFSNIEDNDKQRLILNFEKTSYINSAGIAAIITFFNQAREKNWQVSFSNLSPHFRKVMNIVGLTDFVDIYDNLESALKA